MFNPDGSDSTGLGLRPYAGSTDHRVMAGIRSAWISGLGLDPASTLARTPSASDIGPELDQDNCDPFQDVVIAEASGKTLGYCVVSWWTETDGTVVYRHSEYALSGTGLDVEGVLFGWAEDRVMHLVQRDATGGHATVGANASVAEVARTARLLQHGYVPVFSQVEMVRDNATRLPIVAVPRDIDVRQATPDQLRRLWEFNNEVYVGRAWVQIPTENDYVEFADDQCNDFSLWQVAWDGERVAGMVCGTVRKRVAIIEEVSVGEGYRRKGIGGALLCRVLQELASRGHAVVRLHTNGENVAGARSLYEQFSFACTETHVRYRKPIAPTPDARCASL